jgi:hypothetical protein
MILIVLENLTLSAILFSFASLKETDERLLEDLGAVDSDGLVAVARSLLAHYHRVAQRVLPEQRHGGLGRRHRVELRPPAG